MSRVRQARLEGHRVRCPGGAADAGFTLVEVVVAMVLFAVVLAATGATVVRALRGTGETHRAVAAVLVANEALERARATAAQVDGTGTTPLTSGRSPALVDAVPVADLDLSDTRLAYGTSTAAPPVLPVTSTSTVDGTAYAVRTVLGTCVRDAAGGPCDQAGGHTSPVTMYRVVAAVTWPGCSARDCPVTASTLIDASQDPAFDVTANFPPVARDKCFSTQPGTDLYLDPTYKSYALRDSGQLGSAPVQIVSQPGQGTLTPVAGSASWLYKPGCSCSSVQTSFTYRLVDRYNRTSNPATISLHVGGSPC